MSPIDDVGDPAGYAARGGTVSLSGSALREFLAAVLDRGVPFRFTARGVSMYPFVRDGDLVTVAPLRARGPREGDVVAVRGREDRLIVHRLVATECGEYETRGDNCPESDGRVSGDAVLGIVTRVERAGRPVRFGAGPVGEAIARLSRAGRLHATVATVHLPHRLVGGALRAAQGAPACRRALRRLRPAVIIARAAPADEAELARRFSLRTDLSPRRGDMEVNVFVARMGGGGDAGGSGRIVGTAAARGRIVGFVEVVRRGPGAAPFDGFWINATMVARPFRGMGIAEGLMQRTIATAREAGARELLLTVFADNLPALALYRKVGFVPGGSPALTERLDAEARAGGRRQAPMRLTLNSAGVQSGAALAPGDADAAKVVA